MEAVYAAFATAEGLAGWMSMEAVLIDREGKELDPGAVAGRGDRFRLLWHTEHTEEGKYLEANGTDAIHYTFGEGVAVRISLEGMEDGSVMVTVEQTQDRSDEENLQMMLGFSVGWSFYLANLKSVLEGGLDLRNYTHDIEHRINY